MPNAKSGAGARSGMKVDTALVRELAEMLSETGLTEIEVEEGERRIRVARGGLAAPASVSAPVSAPVSAAVAAPAATPAAAEAPAGQPAVEAGDLSNALRSPMVGTAYLSGDPESAPFVSVGDSVKEGDTLLIVEAMKVMNPITANKAGTIKQVLVANADPVEFDQPLVIIA